MQPSRRSRFIAVVALVAAAAALLWYEPISGRTRQASELSRQFAAWPSFVASWHVRSGSANGIPVPILSSLFGDDPCATFPSDSCYARLAWGGFARWSLTASKDEVFDPLDPRQLTVGPLHYALNGGVLIGVLDHDRLPRLHVCHRLQRRQRAGEDIRISPGEDFEPLGRSVMLQGGGETAVCSEEEGIPVAHSRPGHFWEQGTVELRPPTEAEIGADLVQVISPGPSCGVEPPLSSIRIWFADVVASAGFQPGPPSPELGLTAPGVPDRPARAWTTEEAAVLTGARQRLLMPGLVSTELLRPAIVSIPVGGLRIWLTFDNEADRPFTELEHDLFVLGQVAKRLHTAGADHPYRGPPPAAEGCGLMG